MNIHNLLKYIIPIFLLLGSNHKCVANSDIKDPGRIYGNLKLDETWATEIYLSLIPTFEDIYLVSKEVIISKSDIDSLGNFSFDISFLPENEKLFRIHIVNKGDTPNTLIIGGKYENHLFLLANSHSNIEIINSGFDNPPFKNVCVNNSNSNSNFQRIRNLIYTADSVIVESNAMKGIFIENQLHKELRLIADTCSNPLVSLYAIYNSDFASNYNENLTYYKSYLKKWDNQKNTYFEAFRNELPPIAKKTKTRIIIFLVPIILISIGFYIGKRTKNKEPTIKHLSVQERKVLELLKKGATNQEISEEYHIGVNTVKSHVNNIYKKME